MFVPFLTPVWGQWVKLLGVKPQVDKLLFGKGVKAEVKKIE